MPERDQNQNLREPTKPLPIPEVWPTAEEFRKASEGGTSLAQIHAENRRKSRLSRIIGVPNPRIRGATPVEEMVKKGWTQISPGLYRRDASLREGQQPADLDYLLGLINSRRKIYNNEEWISPSQEENK